MSFPSTTYQPVPTESSDSGYNRDKEHFESLQTEKIRLERRRIRRIIHLTFISLFAIIYMAFFILRGSFGPSKAGNWCRNTMHAMKMGPSSETRNITAAAGQLPTHFTLPSGDKLPSVGLGVWRSGPDEVGEAIKKALKVGYRHIDGAWIYKNEHEVGQAIKTSGVPRKDIWLTSKLWNSFHEPVDVEPALDESLANLGTDYVDLYLMHWPIAFIKSESPKTVVDHKLTGDPFPTWQAMEELVLKGKVRNIGVSNFNIARLLNLTSNNLRIKPAVNQVELSYWNPQPELVKWAKEHNLLLEAYSPLGSVDKVKESLEIPEAKRIAKKLNMTPAQVYISWAIQRGTVVLPKSVTPSRIEENFQVARLPQNAFDLLEAAAISHKPHRSVDPSKSWGVDIFQTEECASS